MKTIALVAPSGNIKDINEINNKIKILEKYFNVKKFYNENNIQNYLSDTDINRIKYFESAFLDNEVDIVLSLRGGYGAIRIVDKIDYKKINCNKIYIGSSDATIFLIALSSKTKIKCYHSLMLANGFLDNIERNLEIINNNSFNLNLIPINNCSNFSSGILWGGNLSSIVSMLSNQEFLPAKDIILFLEDINEPLYKIDKMLYEIYRCNQLKKLIKGIIFGDFYFDRKEILPLFRNFAELFNVNCYYTNDITHKNNNITLPFAKKITLKS